MLFMLTRYIILAVIFVPLIIVLNKKKILKKKYAAPIIIVAFLLFSSAISSFPVENAFLRFDTPEQAFYYVETGKYDYVVEGENSSMVVYKKDSNTYSQIFLLKDEKGYMLNSFYGYALIDRIFDGNHALDIFKVKNTDDYYITGVLVSDASNIELKSDTRDVVCNVFYKENSVIFYAYVKEYADDIYLVCDGEKVELQN